MGIIDRGNIPNYKNIYELQLIKIEPYEISKKTIAFNDEFTVRNDISLNSIHSYTIRIKLILKHPGIVSVKNIQFCNTIEYKTKR